MPTIFGANTESAAYEIANSLRFNDDDSAKLERTVGTPTNEKIYTVSAWVKRGNTGLNNTIIGSPPEGDRILVGDRFEFFTNGSASSYLRTNALARDPAAWYHVVVAYDVTQGTAANRVKYYVNGEQLTFDLSTTFPSQNDTNGKINKSSTTLEIGHGHNGYCDGYMADFYLIDGQALDPTYFGKTDTNGVWIPKEYTGTYGNNGFLLEFKQTGTSANSSGMGADTSGNDNHFTPSNLQTDGRHITTDTPTNNFCTLNPLATNSRGTFSNGNVKVTLSLQGSVPYGQVEFGTFFVNSGKWYYEVFVVENGAGGQVAFGWNERYESGNYFNGHNNLGSAGNIWYGDDGKIRDGSVGETTSPATFADSDIIGIACDFDNHKFYAHKNGTYQSNGTGTGDPSNGTNGFTLTSAYNDYWTPWMSKDSDNASHNPTVNWNFGNGINVPSSGNADANGYGNFEYAVPTGFYSLCTKNLAEYG
mgnify:CR=1 FL=1